MNRKANGASIVAIRKAVGIQQVSLAGRVGIDKSHLNKIESGARQPAPDVLRRIADELGVALEAISYPVVVVDASAS